MLTFSPGKKIKYINANNVCILRVSECEIQKNIFIFFYVDFIVFFCELVMVVVVTHG